MSHLAARTLPSVEDVKIPGRPRAISARVFRPASRNPLPTILFLHGGGWVQGSVAAYDSLTRELARSLPATVVSIDYRLAPEHPYPAALQDSLAALKWVHQKIRDLGGDPKRLVIAGDSAGGSLAAILARHAARQGIPVALQVLVYPSVDLSGHVYPSYEKLGQGYFLTLKGMNSMRDFYLPRPADRHSPEVSPILARDRDLKSVAPALVVLAGCDLLQDEGLAYARRLFALDVPTRIQWETGMTHGFLSALNNANNPRMAADVAPLFEKMMSQMREMLAAVK